MNGNEDNELRLARFLAQESEATESWSEESLTADELAELNKAMAGLQAIQFLQPQTPDHSVVINSPNETIPVGLPQSDSDPADTKPSTYPSAEAPGQIGRFRILQTLGTGGHGTVLLAFDPKLDREVALKIPNATTMMNPESRKRFIREAKTAAVLSHPAIVPVFEAGNIGPVTYIVYKYCPGTALSHWIKSRPIQNETWIDSKTAARIAERIAEAVQYAHQRGVIHRDLKPANILLETTEATGNIEAENVADSLKVADFGLAKFSGDEESLTQTKGVVGTPSYMSPEQAAGDPDSGELGDVYSIGAILYELLTGQPPHRKETILATLKAVSNDPVVDPRKLQPTAGKDVSAVCLKCLEKDPAKRYQSAYQLANDLRAICESRPVSVTHPTVWQSFEKWCRRNPIIVRATSAAVLASLVAMTIALWWVNDAKKGEQLANQRATANLERAKKIVEDFFVVTETEIKGLPGNSPVRKSLCQKALGFYDEFRLLSTPDDRPSAASLAKTTYSMGLILRENGEFEAAYEKLLDAHEQYERLAHSTEFSEPASAEQQKYFEVQIANVTKSQASLLAFWGRLDESRKPNQDALQAFVELRKKYPEDSYIECRWLVCRNDHSDIMIGHGEHSAALDFASETQNLIGSSIATENELACIRFVNQYQLATAQLALGNYETGVSLLESSRELAAKPVRNPADIQFMRRAESRVGSRLRFYKAFLGEEKEPKLDEYQTHVNFLEQQAEQNPHDVTIKEDLSSGLGNLANVLMDQGEIEAAIGLLQRSIKIAQDVASTTNFKHSFHSKTLGVSYNNLARCFTIQKKWAQAIEMLELAIQHTSVAHEGSPTSITIFQNFVNHHHGMAESLSALGRDDEALEMFDQAIELATDLCRLPNAHRRNRDHIVALLKKKMAIYEARKDFASVIRMKKLRLLQFLKLVDMTEKHREFYRKTVISEAKNWTSAVAQRGTVKSIPNEVHALLDLIPTDYQAPQKLLEYLDVMAEMEELQEKAMRQRMDEIRLALQNYDSSKEADEEF